METIVKKKILIFRSLCSGQQIKVLVAQTWQPEFNAWNPQKYRKNTSSTKLPSIPHAPPSNNLKIGINFWFSLQTKIKDNTVMGV